MSALPPVQIIGLMPEQLADAYDDGHCRRAWWLELHSRSDLFTGTTITDLEKTVATFEKGRADGPVPPEGVDGVKTDAVHVNKAFRCPINEAECDYPSCIVPGSPFATDSCIAEQMKIRTGDHSTHYFREVGFPQEGL